MAHADNAALQAPDAEAFRQAFRHAAASVWVVTAAHAGQRTGFTATSVVSLCAEPALLMLSVQPQSSSLPLLQAAGRFGVNLLTPAQQAVSERFAGRDGSQGAQRYAHAGWHCAPGGVWLLDGAAVAMCCDVAELCQRSTHVLITGRIRALRSALPGTQPLLYADGRYTRPMP